MREHRKDMGETTLGVIVEIPQPLHGQLRDGRAQFAVPGAPHVPPHVTILSGAGTRELDVALEHVRAVVARAEPFRIALGPAQSFRPLTPVVFLPLLEGGGQLRALREQLRCPALTLTSEYPYHPHLTLAHQDDDALLDRAARAYGTFAASFLASKIGIYEFGPDGRWLRMEELTLGE